MSTILILAHATDAGAASVATRLRRVVGPRAVRTVRPEVLSSATWSHRVDAHGNASTRLSLPNADPILCGDVGVVLNRIQYLPVPRFRKSACKDRDYAGAEIEALIASWLAALGNRVVHVVREHPWVRPCLPLQRWAAIAAFHGLPVGARTIATSERWARPARERSAVPLEALPPAGSVLVAGDEVEGTLTERYGAACRATARALRCFPLLEFGFADVDGGPALVAVEPVPALDRTTAVAATCRLLAALLERAPKAA